MSLVNNGWTIVVVVLLTFIYMFNKNHLLMNLITIEAMSMIMLIMSLLFCKKLSMEYFIMFYIIIIFLMESVLGISILLSMIRTHSNDYIKSLTILKL